MTGTFVLWPNGFALAAQEHQEMNEQVKVTRRSLRTIAHTIIVHDIVSEAYIHFALMYMTDHILPVLPIKNLINEDGDPTMPFKHTTGTKPSVSHLRVLFFHMLYGKLLHTLTKGVKYMSPSAKGFSWYLCWNSTALKMVSCVRIQYKEDNIFI